MRITIFAALGAASFVLCACAATQAESGAVLGGEPKAGSVEDHAAKNRHGFVQAACGGCHAVDPPGLSPNPQAPSFEAIANQPGLTDETLAAWLSDAHNYPEIMDFDLEPRHVDWITQHMIGLRREDYTPPPS